MKDFTQISAWVKERSQLSPLLKVGFVPTMGALHEGHASLLKRAREENDIVVLSIYVNPTQFNNREDLKRYPNRLEADRAIALASGVDYLLLPQFSEIYSDDYKYKVSESELSSRLCGAHRPGHFDGVLTVVMKLLNLVRADRAYFGEKDYQQFQLIKGMAEAFFLQTEIVPCATVREQDGLAMSSRNLNLTSAEREKAPILNQILKRAKTAEEAYGLLSEAGFTVDYVEDIGDRRFAAATLGAVRLIDNVQR